MQILLLAECEILILENRQWFKEQCKVIQTTEYQWCNFYKSNEALTDTIIVAIYRLLIKCFEGGNKTISTKHKKAAFVASI